jgi:hypothetical protein
VSLVTISLVYGEDITFALFALTMVFVIFNKVCTAQVSPLLKTESVHDAVLDEHIPTCWVLVVFLVVHGVPALGVPVDESALEVERRAHDRALVW